MRSLMLGVLLLALVGAGGFAAVASRHAGGHSCSSAISATSAAGEGSCTSTGAGASTGRLPASGNIEGNFDAAMSGVCRFACATKLTYEARDVLAQPGAKPARLTQCPVSGVVFLVDAGRPRVRVAGQDYATCCDRCATKLEHDPRHYLKKS
jgi:hypothetical protein